MSEVTQWFSINTPPVRYGWYIIKKGGFTCMGRFARGRFGHKRFCEFNYPTVSVTRATLADYLFSDVTEWRGLANKP